MIPLMSQARPTLSTEALAFSGTFWSKINNETVALRSSGQRETGDLGCGWQYPRSVGICAGYIRAILASGNIREASRSRSVALAEGARPTSVRTLCRRRWEICLYRPELL